MHLAALEVGAVEMFLLEVSSAGFPSFGACFSDEPGCLMLGVCELNLRRNGVILAGSEQLPSAVTFPYERNEVTLLSTLAPTLLTVILQLFFQ